jgi:hypothetical protein
MKNWNTGIVDEAEVGETRRWKIKALINLENEGKQ